MKLYKVEVKGMMCGMCESHVADTIRKAFSEVEKVKANRKKNLLEFRSNANISKEEIINALKPTGYEIGDISIEEK